MEDETKGYGHIDFAALNWRKGTRSGGGGSNCVEVADLPDGGFAMRDSKNLHKAPMVFTAGEKAAFVEGVKNEGLLD